MEATTSTAGGYGCSVDELKQLMEVRGAEALEKIHQDFGSIQEICNRLRTDPNRGLNDEGVERSREAFGPNVIPPAPAKKFLELVWEALQDTTLIILIVAAVISLGLSFYRPPSSIEGQTGGKTEH